MTRWSTTTKHEPESINNGNKYELKDRVSIEQLNNMTENAFYAMDKASDAIKKAEEALGFAQGSGTTVFVNGEPVSQFNADQKADVTELNNYYTKEQVDDLLGEPVDIDLSNYYTKDQTYSKQEVDDKLANLDVDVDFSDYYTKNETDNLLSNYATTYDLNYKVSNSLLSYYTKVETDEKLLTKQNKISSTNMISSDFIDDNANTHKFVTAEEKKTWNNKSDFSGNYNDLTNKPTIPDTSNFVTTDTPQQSITALKYFKEGNSTNFIGLGVELDNAPAIIAGFNGSGRFQKLQDKSGTIALIEDIPTSVGIKLRRWS